MLIELDFEGVIALFECHKKKRPMEAAFMQGNPTF
jgi:hypothetical protein